jgi:hypothetical protein
MIKMIFALFCCFYWLFLVFILLQRMGGRGRVNPTSGRPFHANFNELLFVLIALTLTEILVDCDGS